MAVIFLVNGVVMGTWAAQIPLLEERLEISHSTLGVALLAMALGALVAMPLTGMFIARFGSAAVTFAATPVLLLALPVSLLAPGPGILMVSLFFYGGANGVMDVAMNAHAVTVERKLGRPVMSSLHGMWSLGGLIGAGWAAIMLPLMSPVAEAVLTVAIGAVAAFTALAFFLSSTIDRGSAGTKIALPNRATLGIGALCFLGMVAEGAVLDWGALHLRGSLDVGPGVAATGFAAFSASMAASRFSGDWLRGRVGSVAVVRWSALPSRGRHHRRVGGAMGGPGDHRLRGGRPWACQSRARALRSRRADSGTERRAPRSRRSPRSAMPAFWSARRSSASSPMRRA